MNLLAFFLNLLSLLGIWGVLVYGIGSLLSRGPLGNWAWLIMIYIGYKLSKKLF